MPKRVDLHCDSNQFGSSCWFYESRFIAGEEHSYTKASTAALASIAVDFVIRRSGTEINASPAALFIFPLSLISLLASLCMFCFEKKKHFQFTNKNKTHHQHSALFLSLILARSAYTHSSRITKENSCDWEYVFIFVHVCVCALRV